MSPRRQLQLDFWIGFREYVLEHRTQITPTKPQARHWMTMSVGRTGFQLAAIASFSDSGGGGYDGHELRAELAIKDRDYYKEYYDLLLAQKADIEEEMGQALTWYYPENARSCRIFAQQSTDLEDLSARDQQYAWLLEKLEKMHEAFADRVRELEVPISDG